MQTSSCHRTDSLICCLHDCNCSTCPCVSQSVITTLLPTEHMAHMYTLGLRRVRCGISEPKAGGGRCSGARGPHRHRPGPPAPPPHAHPRAKSKTPNKAKNKKTEEATASAYLRRLLPPTNGHTKTPAPTAGGTRRAAECSLDRGLGAERAPPARLTLALALLGGLVLAPPALQLEDLVGSRARARGEA